MALWRSGPLRQARRMSCSVEVLRRTLSRRERKSSSMATGRRMGHGGQMAGTLHYLMGACSFWVGLRLMPRNEQERGLKPATTLERVDLKCSRGLQPAFFTVVEPLLQ